MDFSKQEALTCRMMGLPFLYFICVHVRVYVHVCVGGCGVHEFAGECACMCLCLEVTGQS